MFVFIRKIYLRHGQRLYAKFYIIFLFRKIWTVEWSLGPKKTVILSM